MRLCLGCRTRQSQDRLKRLALVCGPADPKVVWDEKRLLGGRGAWLCRQGDGCLKKALRPGVLARAFRLNQEPDAAVLKGPGPVRVEPVEPGPGA